MIENNTIETGAMVGFISKKEEKTGKIVKIYTQDQKTYCKIKTEKKYYYKQLKDVQLCN
jgi:hypothetical protein